MFLKEKEKCINIEKIMSIMEINNDIYLNKNNYGVDVNKEDDDEWIKILEEDDDYSYWEGYIENKIIEGGYEEFVKAFDADTLQEVTDKSERIYCVAREQGK